MKIKSTRPIQAIQRGLIQSAKFAIRDISDAITELVTNSDDRYQILKANEGIIEIEIERRRGKSSSILKVRDFADGMDIDTMDKKIGFWGGRESGMEGGEEVRGTHSRGAKDIAALGHVTFESIANDGKFHKCEITPHFDFKTYESEPAVTQIRKQIGISDGTGTLVTIELEKSINVPQHDNIKKQIEHLVNLRGILGDQHRKIVLRDLNQGQEDILIAPRFEGKERLKETFSIPGWDIVNMRV